MNEPVGYEKRGTIALIAIDNPPVNALSTPVRAGLAACVERATADAGIEAIVVMGAGKHFSAGADIREFDAVPASPTLPKVIESIERLAKPVVAAIRGVALGGGCELALGCHYRVGDPSAHLGLPEIKLGLMPGAGGTQRLPRLVGAERALAMILSGAPVGAQDTLDMGLLDEVVTGELVEGALAFAARAAGRPLARARDRQDKLAATPPDLFERKRSEIAKRARGQMAPELCIESLENALKLPFDEALAAERAMFLRCRASEASRALRHLFFAEREAAKIPDVPADTPAAEVRRAAVIGCGTMGAGIATCFANAGIPVRVLETADDVLAKGLATIRKNYAASVAKGRLSQQDMEGRMEIISGTLDHADAADADIVIEAVFEDMELKKEVFARLDAVCKPEVILATNTSTLDVNEIAAATSRPQLVIGTHFFSPAHVMRLLETVRGARTDKRTIASVMRLAKRLGKISVLVGVCDGFVGNRMYHAYTRQANFLLEEGALPQQVDKVMYEFGVAMGPFATGDLAGLDVSWRIRQRRAKTRPRDERYSPIADRVCELGRFGQKTGAGWYRYEPGSRTPMPDPEIEKLIVSVSAEIGIARRAIDEQEVLERCVYTLINEGARILEEGIALRPGDIDVIWAYGYGFPAWRGGPMFYADTVGLKKIYDALHRLHEVHGEPLKPAPLLQELARTGARFYPR
jgi:3-hydroxyacyl-CoA dehydrogenase